MDVRHEIAKRVEELPPEMQDQVLRFVASLAASTPKGKHGAAFRQFSSSLDAISAQQMTQAIEDGCERVDAGEW
jgi:ADP-dependent phosphofructokinase/glucokinase